MGFAWVWIPAPGFKSQAGFWLCSSPKLDFGWVQVPAHGFKSQSVVNSFSKGTHQGLETEVFSVSHCLCLAQQTFVYQTPLFLSPWKLPFSPLKSPLPLLLILSLRLVFLWRPCICIIKFWFSSISLSHVIFLDQPEDFRKGRGDFFFPPPILWIEHRNVASRPYW